MTYAIPDALRCQHCSRGRMVFDGEAMLCIACGRPEVLPVVRQVYTPEPAENQNVNHCTICGEPFTDVQKRVVCQACVNRKRHRSAGRGFAPELPQSKRIGDPDYDPLLARETVRVR